MAIEGLDQMGCGMRVCLLSLPACHSWMLDSITVPVVICEFHFNEKSLIIPYLEQVLDSFICIPHRLIHSFPCGPQHGAKSTLTRTATVTMLPIHQQGHVTCLWPTCHSLSPRQTTVHFFHIVMSTVLHLSAVHIPQCS